MRGERGKRKEKEQRGHLESVLVRVSCVVCVVSITLEWHGRLKWLHGKQRSGGGGQPEVRPGVEHLIKTLLAVSVVIPVRLRSWLRVPLLRRGFVIIISISG